jgi:hypothetical protein
MRLLRFIFVVLILCNMVFLSYAIGGENIVGLWYFDDGSGTVAKDSSGNKLDGKLINSPEWVKNGKFGGALKFVAVQNPSVRVSLQYNNTVTISMWANYATLIGNIGLLHVQEGNVENADPGSKIIGIWLSNTKMIWGRIITDAGATNNFPQNKALEANTWYNIAVVIDAASQEARQYVNAEEVGKVAYVGGKLKKYDFASIGRQGTESWDGMIDEVAVFNKALSVNELKDVMNGIKLTPSSLEAKGKLAVEWGMIKSDE